MDSACQATPTKNEKLSGPSLAANSRQNFGPPRHWSLVKGPIAATISTLKDIGWRARSMDVWHDPEGEEWELNYEHEALFAEMSEELGRQIESALWRRADRHQGSHELANGADLTVAKKHRRSLMRKAPDIFFCWRLLGLIPGGAPFSQLNRGVKDAMVESTKLVECQFMTKTCKKAEIENNTQKERERRKPSTDWTRKAKEGSGEVIQTAPMPERQTKRHR